MADDFTVLNLGTGGDALDEEGITYGSAPTTRKRARVRLSGSGVAELQEVRNAQPATNAYGGVTRDVNLDIALSALRDAITKTGPTSKTLADIVAALVGLSVSVSNFPGTQPVSLASLPALAAGSAVIGHVRVDTSGALTDRSGTITTGGVAQDAVASNAARRYLLVRNPKNAAESLWLSLVGTATAASPSLEIKAGEAYVAEDLFVPTNAVSLIGATTGHAFTVWEG